MVPAHPTGPRVIPVHERVFARTDFELRLIAAVREYVYEVMNVEGTPGLNLAMGSENRLIWEAGFGYADVASARPMTPETVYHSGSLGKTYTATALMHLVDRRVIRLDDAINQHLPFIVKNPLGERDITVGDLMLHRSGLNTDSAESHFCTPRSLLETVQVEYATDPKAQKWGKRWSARVGEKWIYTNLGLATLGLIIELANPERLSFSAYVQRYVIDPLGMTASQFPQAQTREHVRPDIWENMSTGYSRMGAVWIPSLPVHFGNYPAGTVLGKPADHLRLLLAMSGGGLYNGYQLLNRETAKAMVSPGHDEELLDSRGQYFKQGLIWRIYANGDFGERFNHPGGHMYGWKTQGVAWPNHRLALAVASNQWALPDSMSDVMKLEELMDQWLARQVCMSNGETALAWAKKVSYVRGVLFASSFKTGIGIPEELPMSLLSESGSNARVQPGVHDDWDKDWFLKGIADIGRTDFSFEAVQKFWKESRIVTRREVRAIYVRLGGRLDPTSYLIRLMPDAT